MVGKLTAEEDNQDICHTNSLLDLSAECQDVNPEFKDYLLTGELPGDEKARKLVLSKTQFEIKDGV